MPITSSAKKALRASRKKQVRNYERRSSMKSAIKAVKTAAKEGDAKIVKEATASAMSEIDRALKAGILHRNAASRRKSKIALAAGLAKPKAEKPKAEKPKPEAKPKKVAKKPVKKEEAPVKEEVKKETKKADAKPEKEDPKKKGLFKRMVSRKK